MNSIIIYLIFYRPKTKSRKGNVFTSVCQEFCPRGAIHTHPWADTALGRHSQQADTPWANTLLGRHSPSRKTPLAGRHPPPSRQTHHWQTDTPSPRDGYCSGVYASYWNSFLNILNLNV